MFEQKMAEKIPIYYVYTQFVYQFKSILVANKVYRYFWSLVFWWTFKIRQCLGPWTWSL